MWVVIRQPEWRMFSLWAHYRLLGVDTSTWSMKNNDNNKNRNNNKNQQQQQQQRQQLPLLLLLQQLLFLLLLQPLVLVLLLLLLLLLLLRQSPCLEEKNLLWRCPGLLHEASACKPFLDHINSPLEGLLVIRIYNSAASLYDLPTSMLQSQQFKLLSRTQETPPLQVPAHLDSWPFGLADDIMCTQNLGGRQARPKAQYTWHHRR